VKCTRLVVKVEEFDYDMPKIGLWPALVGGEMKKHLVSFGVCAVLCIVLVGCGCGAVPASSTSTPESPTPLGKLPTPGMLTSEPSPLSTATVDSPLPVSPLPGPPPADGAGWAADGLVAAGEYPHQTETSGVTMYWASDDGFLYAALEAETQGWVAVGFDPQNRMEGANFVFGYVKDGVPHVEDMFGTKPAGLGSHPPDEELGGSNDILEYGGVEMGGVTVIEFKIPLDSGDAYDRPLSAGATYRVLLARGSGDDLTSVHTARGYSEITLD
jgi:hypothetical protein